MRVRRSILSMRQQRPLANHGAQPGGDSSREGKGGWNKGLVCSRGVVNCRRRWGPGIDTLAGNAPRATLVEHRGATAVQLDILGRSTPLRGESPNYRAITDCRFPQTNILTLVCVTVSHQL